MKPDVYYHRYYGTLVSNLFATAAGQADRRANLTKFENSLMANVLRTQYQVPYKYKYVPLRDKSHTRRNTNNSETADDNIAYRHTCTSTRYRSPTETDK
jgi:hypothetical protein